jgi:hypothetical protein
VVDDAAAAPVETVKGRPGLGWWLAANSEATECTNEAAMDAAEAAAFDMELAALGP